MKRHEPEDEQDRSADILRALSAKTSDPSIERIVYQRYEAGDGFETGIAEVEGAPGPFFSGAAPRFEIRVSGQRESIDRYAEEAKILDLRIEPLSQEELDQTMEQVWPELERAHRVAWRARLEHLQQAINAAPPAELADPDLLWRKVRDSESSSAVPVPDLSNGRLIEIRPLTVPDEPYSWTFSVDPKLTASNLTDAYRYVSEEGVVRIEIRLRQGQSQLRLDYEDKHGNGHSRWGQQKSNIVSVSVKDVMIIQAIVSRDPNGDSEYDLFNKVWELLD